MTEPGHVIEQPSGPAPGAYRERPSAVPGAVVWTQATRPGPGRILPDGCMDIILIGERLLVAGADTRAHLVDAGVRPGVRAVGLRFAPGSAPAVLGAPADALTDRRIALDELWPGREVRLLAERVAERGGTALEEAARRRLAGPPDPLLRAVAAAMAAGRPVRGLAAELGVSERQLRRRSLAGFGYAPKTLARILRFGRAVDLARVGIPAAEAAARTGYADQAHLSREVRGLAGVPLSVLLAE